MSVRPGPSASTAAGRTTHGGPRTLLTLVAVYVCLTVAAYTVGEAYVIGWLPLLQVETNWLLPRGYWCDGLRLVTDAAGRWIDVHAVTTIPLAVGAKTLPAGSQLAAATLQSCALTHLLLVFPVLAAWPAPTWRRRLTLLLLGIPCIAITTSLDVPFVLTGLTQQVVLQSLAPEELQSNAAVVYSAFLERGGRLGLALAGALLVAAATRPRAGRSVR